jgi:PIN domain nuclease of toxin-antitoxin system
LRWHDATLRRHRSSARQTYFPERQKPVTPQIVWRSVTLDWAHKDPADRLIVATALEHKVTLVTHDKKISHWGGVPVFW